MVEIYNEQIRDLLVDAEGAAAAPSKGLDIRVDKTGEIIICSLTSITVSDISDVFVTFKRGNSSRATAVTNLNEHSSRSHSLLIVTVATRILNEIDSNMEESVRDETNGKLYLVDLAGSERIGKSGVKGTQLREAQNINRSLSALGNVLEALDTKNKYVPYRDSKLTQVLQECLRPGARTFMVVTVCPTDLTQDETLYALNFAARVKKMKLEAQATMSGSGTVGARSTNATIRTLQDALARSKVEVREANKKRHTLEESVLEMKKEKKKATDKIGMALEVRSRQLVDEKDKAESHASSQTRRVDELTHRLAEEREAKQAAATALQKAEASLRKAQEKIKRAEQERDLVMLTLKDKEKAVDRMAKMQETATIAAAADETARRRHEVLRGREMNRNKITNMTNDSSGSVAASPSYGITTPRPIFTPKVGSYTTRPTPGSRGGVGVGSVAPSPALLTSTKSARPNVTTPATTLTLDHPTPAFGANTPPKTPATLSQGPATAPSTQTHRAARASVPDSQSGRASLSGDLVMEVPSLPSTSSGGATGGGVHDLLSGDGAGGVHRSSSPSVDKSAAATTGATRRSARLASQESSQGASEALSHAVTDVAPMTRSQAATAKHRERLAKKRAEASKKSKGDFW